MEQFNEDNLSKRASLYEAVDGIKSFISTFLGVIVALVGIVLVFVISSLEGIKEIKASNKENAVIIGMWREENDSLFPEDRVDIINYNDKEYYFVVEKLTDDGEILEWYFAYDGGLGYVFKDYKFYILTGITIMVSIFVAQINYTTAVNSTMNTTKFLKTLKAYQDSKNKIAKSTQYIPMFCAYKNKQLYNDTKREIVESANISYDFYSSPAFDITKLEQWQRDILEGIKKIKIERIAPSDLLQEKSKNGRRIALLPIAPEKHRKNYLMLSSIQKFFSSILSGMTVALGVVLGNWFLGITYGFTVLLSFIMANISGADYANSGLRQRYIAKADLLNEFYNMIDYFVEQEKELAKKEVNSCENDYPLLVVNEK
ncbi:MAG: hypothetical protein PHP55_10600 [Methanoculleus sp.]|nr:hypothetical protein [Methanoculleus sp.]